jgi:hypothetical protein
MAPDWLRQERRSSPSREEVEALVALNLRIVAEQVEENKCELRENTELLTRLQFELSSMNQLLQEHKKSSEEMLDSFKFLKRLKAFGWGVFIILAAILAFAKDGLDIIHHWFK